MAFITVNRVRIRSWRIIPALAFTILFIYRQARRAPGCNGLRIFRTRGLAVWTVTSWTDETAMLRFRDSGPHGSVRPKKAIWFDEAAIAHWHQESSRLPSNQQAAERLLEIGRLSHVCFPSTAHAAGKIVTT